MSVVDTLLVAFGFKIDTKGLGDLEKATDGAAKKATQDAEKIKAAWEKVGSSLNTLAIGIGGAVTALGALVVKSAAAGAAIDDISKQTGVSVKEFQRLNFAVEMGGGTVEDTKNSFKFLAKALVDARDSASPAAKAFDQLGLNAGRLNDRSLSTEERFALLADAFAKVEDSSLRTDLALTIFGRGGLALVPTLTEGSAALKKMGDEAETLGLVKTEATIQKMAELDDQILKLKMRAAAFGSELAERLLPLIDNVTQNSGAWATAIGALGVAWAALKIPSMIAQIGQLASTIKLLANSFAGPIAAALAFGAALGTALDQWLDLSGRIAGTSGPKGARGAPPLLGSTALSSVEQAVLTSLDDRLQTASGSEREELLAQRKVLMDKDAFARREKQAEQQRLTDAERQQVEDTLALQGIGLTAQAATAALQYDLGKKKASTRRGSAARPSSPSDAARKKLEGSDMFNEIAILANRAGATPAQLEEAYKAAAEANAGHASDRVAKQAGVSRLSSLVGFEVGGKYQDPLLSEMFGEATLPPVPLSELERGQTPQVLISTINNTYTVDAPISINGAGEPSAVGTALQEAIRSLFRDEVDKVSRFSKTVFQR